MTDILIVSADDHLFLPREIWENGNQENVALFKGSADKPAKVQVFEVTEPVPRILIKIVQNHIKALQ